MKTPETDPLALLKELPITSKTLREMGRWFKHHAEHGWLISYERAIDEAAELNKLATWLEQFPELARRIETLEASRPWICFHCGFGSSDPAEAQAHFGERDDAEEFTPLCKWWSKLTSEERAQEIQSLQRQIVAEQEETSIQRTRIEGLEYQVEGQRSEIHSFKPFRNCDSIHQVFHAYDSMEGRALAAEERVAALTKAYNDQEAELEQHATDRVNQRKRLETLEAENARLTKTLSEIADYKVEPFEHPQTEWDKHTPETCTECKRWRDMKHPLQHHCDDWYRLLHSRSDRNAFEEAAQHWHMRKIAREALDSARQAAPEVQG